VPAPSSTPIRAIELAVEQAGVVERLGRGHHAELFAPRPAAALRWRKRAWRSKVDLAGDLAAERRHVEQRDPSQAAQAGDHVSQLASRLAPSDETMPMPVMATRRSLPDVLTVRAPASIRPAPRRPRTPRRAPAE
jgi:hypothetical protein